MHPQSHEGLVDVGTSLGPPPKPSQLVEPAHGALDYLTISPRAAAMLGVSSRGDRFDAPLLEHRSMTPENCTRGHPELARPHSPLRWGGDGWIALPQLTRPAV